MKLLIAGSRSIEHFDLSPYIPLDTDTIISGGARGIDTLAERYADARGLRKIIIRPNYDLYGRRAPLVRNDEMIALADTVLVIWDGISHGSKYTIDRARRAGKRVIVISEHG